MTSFLIWATLSAILAIIEVLTLWIWSICLAAGALAAGVASLCGASLAIQTVCAALGHWHSSLPSERRSNVCTNAATAAKVLSTQIWMNSRDGVQS